MDNLFVCLLFFRMMYEGTEHRKGLENRNIFKNRYYFLLGVLGSLITSCLNNNQRQMKRLSLYTMFCNDHSLLTPPVELRRNNTPLSAERVCNSPVYPVIIVQLLYMLLFTDKHIIICINTNNNRGIV